MLYLNVTGVSEPNSVRIRAVLSVYYTFYRRMFTNRNFRYWSTCICTSNSQTGIIKLYFKSYLID
jgi:hypothetical protein